MKSLLAFAIVALLLVGGAWAVIQVGDALTYPWGQPPITWPDEPIIETPDPTPPIVEPGTGIPYTPPLEPGTHNQPNVPDPRSTGGNSSCANGTCPTSEPSQSSDGTYRRFLFGRNRR